VQVVALHQVQDRRHALDLQPDAGLRPGLGQRGLDLHPNRVRPGRDDERPRGHLRQRHRRPDGRARLAPRRDQVQALLQHRLQLDRRGRGGVVDRGAVDAALHQPLHHVGGQALDHGQRGRRQPRAEGLHQRRGQAARQARRQPEGQRAGGRAAQRLELLPGALHLLQDAAAVCQQPAAGVGERHAAAVALEQVLAQLHLERPHLAAERRLRDPQHAGCAREAAELGHLHEVLDLLEVHRARIVPPAMPQRPSS
jgi:hypothetical protein